MNNPEKIAPFQRWVFLALALAFILLCSCMEEPAGTVIPCNQPKGLHVFPAEGDTDVPLDPVVTVTFDTLKDTASFDSTSIILVHGTDTIGGTTFYQPSDTTLFFVPDDSLKPNTPYIITVTVPTDSVVPNPIGPLGPPIILDTTVTWTFTTTDTTQDSYFIPHPPPPVLFEQGVEIRFELSTSPPPFNLYWFPAAGALTYRMQVSASPLFTTTVFDLSGIVPQNTPLVHQGVSPSIFSVGTYYFRVDASNNSGTSAWSNVFAITIDP